MDCPVCKNIQLEKKSYQDGALILDRCPGCNGAWFDKGELHILLGSRSIGYFEIPRISPQIDQIHCPMCRQGMYELCYPGTTVFIDMCKSCQGIWLNHNEWKEINVARSALITESIAKKSVAKSESPGLTNHKVNPTSYSDDIPGIKGSLLRLIERSISYLTNY